METTNPTHFQLGIQITHYADILRYCTGSHVTRSVIVLQVTCYQQQERDFLLLCSLC